MKKIPTMFNRDWIGDRGVLDSPNLLCQWVFDGEGIATIKLDGTCVLVKDGERWKRRELRRGERVPDGFVEADYDAETGKTMGWVRVGDGPEDKWHREASGGEEDGTYELVGPKIQGNPEGYPYHMLVWHGSILPADDPPRTFAGLKAWFSMHNVEGLVFHHPDGRMAKIKARDFGLKREKRVS